MDYVARQVAGVGQAAIVRSEEKIGLLQKYSDSNQKELESGSVKEWQTSKLAEAIENLYGEKDVIVVIKLIIFAKKMEKDRTVNSFPTNEEANEYLKKNVNLNSNDLNNIFQQYFLSSVFGKKIPIRDKKRVNIMKAHSKDLESIFTKLGLWSGIDTTDKINKENKITQIRILGTNHLFAGACLKDFVDKINKLKNDGLLSDDCKIVLLTGNHKNKGFVDDDYTENEEFNLLFGEKFAGLPVVNCVSEKKVLKRPNTIDTIIKADKDEKCRTDGNVLYLGQPVILNRQRSDIFVHYNKINEAEKFDKTFYYSPNFDNFQEKLKEYAENETESRKKNEARTIFGRIYNYIHNKRLERIQAKRFELLDLSYPLCLDAMARSAYAHTKSGYYFFKK